MTMLLVRRRAKTGSSTPSPATTPEVKERKTIRQRIKARRLAVREQKMKTLDDKDTPAVDAVDATSPVSLSSSASATAASSGAPSSAASLGWWQRTDKKLRSTFKKLDLTAATNNHNGSQLKTSRDRSPTTLSASKSSSSASSPKQPSTPRDRRGRKTGGSAIAGLNPSSSATKKRQAASAKKKKTTSGAKKSSRARAKSKSEAEPEDDDGTTTGSNTNTEDEEVSTTDGEGGGGRGSGTGRRRGSRVVAEEGPEAARGMMGRLGRRWSLVCFHPSELNRV